MTRDNISITCSCTETWLGVCGTPEHLGYQRRGLGRLRSNSLKPAAEANLGKVLVTPTLTINNVLRDKQEFCNLRFAKMARRKPPPATLSCQMIGSWQHLRTWAKTYVSFYHSWYRKADYWYQSFKGPYFIFILQVNVCPWDALLMASFSGGTLNRRWQWCLVVVVLCWY